MIFIGLLKLLITLNILDLTIIKIKSQFKNSKDPLLLNVTPKLTLQELHLLYLRKTQVKLSAKNKKYLLEQKSPSSKKTLTLRQPLKNLMLK